MEPYLSRCLILPRSRTDYIAGSHAEVATSTRSWILKQLLTPFSNLQVSDMSPLRHYVPHFPSSIAGMRRVLCPGVCFCLEEDTIGPCTFIFGYLAESTGYFPYAQACMVGASISEQSADSSIHQRTRTFAFAVAAGRAQASWRSGYGFFSAFTHAPAAER